MHHRWQCLCDCGILKEIDGRHLNSGATKSCGCLSFDNAVSRSHSGLSVTAKTHGMCKTPEYSVWRGMLNRCENEKEKAYPRYGGRGILVCGRWRDSFENFFSDMGERPSKHHSIDRIDNNGNYDPKNCRWATREMQASNKSSTVMLQANGQTLPLAEWSRIKGIAKSTLWARKKYGWSDSDIVNKPLFTTHQNRQR